MKPNIVQSLIWIYRRLLQLYPSDFRDEFGEEMGGVFQELLAQQGPKGTWAVLLAGGREFYHLPLALSQAYLDVWFKKHIGQTLFHYASQSPFHPIPPTVDGRFSWRQTLLEMMPLVVTAVCLFILVYHRPAWVPTGWQHQWPGLGWFMALFALPILCLGLARGLPRWAYPVGGLLLGYSLLLTHWSRLAAFWGGLLLAVFILGLTAVYTHLYSQPLPPFLQRIGQSMSLDWTRLCFGLYGIMPCLLLMAFDGVYPTDRTPYMALSLLLMVLGALFYGRCRQQPQQLAVLITAVSVTLLPPLLHQSTFQINWLADVSWLAGLWTFMLSLLLLPVLGRLIYQTWVADNAAATKGAP
jgi:hypothetical protein